MKEKKMHLKTPVENKKTIIAFALVIKVHM